MKKIVLLTRPRSSSEGLATLLSYRGFDSIIEPLLTIEPLSTPLPSGPFQASMITSASVFEVLENKKELFLELFDHPCYCVGEATGEAAHRFGFTEIRNGDSDSAQLAKKIIDDGATTKRLLHISGDIADNKAHDILAPKGVELIPWPVYHARAATDFSRETTNAFRAGEINAILLFSPRSAQILVSLLQKSGLVQSCFSIAAIALSQAVANMLKNIPWRELRVATAPTEEAVLTCLGKRPDDTDGTTT